MKVVVFYGTECDDKTAWIPWLKEQLTNQVLNVLFLICQHLKIKHTHLGQKQQKM